jgi:aspartate/methionine/tyrosine aminotransferase
VLAFQGNPTGACLTADNLRAVLQFCRKNRLVLLADEVYQENIYNPRRPFVSARAALATLPQEVQAETELISFHTVSKGPYGECGLRGGYMELFNIDPAVVDQLYKLASINLSPNVVGQVGRVIKWHEL